MAAESGPEWSIRINIPCTLELIRQEQLWRRFRWRSGKKRHRPHGNFTIINIIRTPLVSGGPTSGSARRNNPLGGYWLGLTNGYGIHGNNKPASIGSPESNGCIRMHNQDVALLVQLIQVGTPVEILYQTMEVDAVQDKIWLTLYPDHYHRETDVREGVTNALRQKNLLYPVHWTALWRLIEEDRPLIIEIPRELTLFIDGEEYPQTAFYWGEQAFLTTALAGLWGEEREEPFIELVEFMRSYAGQVYGILINKRKALNFTLYGFTVTGRFFPLRGGSGRTISSLAASGSYPETIGSAGNESAFPGSGRGTVGFLYQSSPVLAPASWRGMKNSGCSGLNLTIVEKPPLAEAVCPDKRLRLA